MSASKTTPAARPPRELPPWLVHTRRVINTVFPLLLAGLMLFSAVPTDEVPQALGPLRERLGGWRHNASRESKLQHET